MHLPSLSLLATAVIGLACQSTSTTTPQEGPKMHGYAYGSHVLEPSPVSLKQLQELQTSLLFGEDDVAALRMSLEVLRPNVEDILDVWYGFVGSTPHLLAYFSDPATGKPDSEYLAAVRKRFGAWVLDTAAAKYDDKWLAWQHEIGLRHHSTKKNLTDGGKGPSIVHFSHMVALTIPVTTTLKPFLEKGGHTPEEVERMHQAWIKSVLLQTILWSHPFVNEGEF